jgi:L-threonylcarbamoyladenylate synthase
MNSERIVVSATHPDPVAIAHAVAIIRRGGIVAMPTETVYGLAGDARNPQAVQAIFVAKGRPATDPLIVHIADYAQLVGVVGQLPTTFALLSEAFWPGPLTMLVPKHPTLDPAITAGRDSVAVRMPHHAAALALIRASDCPLVAPSANLFSHPSPTSADHVLNDLNGRIDAVLDAGSTSIGVESTIIDLTCTPPRILRQGGVPAEQLATVLGDVTIHTTVIRDTDAAPAPGMLLKHYSPQAPVTIFRGTIPAIQAHIITMAQANPTLAWLCYDDDVAVATQAQIPYASLGVRSNGALVATRLFAAIRQIDTRTVTQIVTSEPLGDGVAAAVRDRLFRAAEGRIVAVSL